MGVLSIKKCHLAWSTVLYMFTYFTNPPLFECILYVLYTEQAGHGRDRLLGKDGIVPEPLVIYMIYLSVGPDSSLSTWALCSYSFGGGWLRYSLLSGYWTLLCQVKNLQIFYWLKNALAKTAVKFAVKFAFTVYKLARSSGHTWKFWFSTTHAIHFFRKAATRV